MRKVLVAVIELGLVIGCLAGGKAQWRVVERIHEYGDNLTLICSIEKTLQKSEDVKRWYKGEILLSLNDDSSDETKYRAQIVTGSVKLTILNFDNKDVNKSYHCEIGFHKSEERILQEDCVFKVSDGDIFSKSKLSENGINITVPVVISVFILLVVIPILVCYFLRCSKEGNRRDTYVAPKEASILLNEVNAEKGQNGAAAVLQNGAPEEASLLENEENAENDQNGAEAVLQNGDEDTEDTCVLSIDCQKNTDSNQDQDHSTLPKEFDGIHETTFYFADGVDSEMSPNGADAIVSNGEHAEGIQFLHTGNQDGNETDIDQARLDDVDTDDTCILSIDSQMNTDSNQDQDQSALPKGGTESPPVKIQQENAENNLYQPPPSTGNKGTESSLVNIQQENAENNLYQPPPSSGNEVGRLPAFTLFKGIGKHAALALSGSATEVALTDSRGEQNDMIDPKIPHCEPINRGFQFSLPDQPIS